MRFFYGFCALWLTWLASGNAYEPKIFCYFYGLPVGDSDYYETMDPFDIEPSLCTHLIYASIGVTEDGEVEVLEPQINLRDNKGDPSFLKLNLLRSRNQKLKTLVSSGNWEGGSAKYAKIAANATLRSKYVENVVTFVLQKDFNGFDINWQFPNADGDSPEDVDNFILLLRELRRSFDKYELILTVAVEGAEQGARRYYDIPQISRYADFILLSMECHNSSDSNTGHSAPLYPAARELWGSDRKLNIDASVHYWLNEGASAEKLILGTQFHGLGYQLEDSDEHEPGSPASGPSEYDLGLGSIGYNEICSRISRDASWTTVWDEEQHVPYSYTGKQWISYDNVRSLTEKAKYAKALGLGGVMAWSIDLDDHRGNCGERFPLLRALNCGLREIGCNSVLAPVKTAYIMRFNQDLPLFGENVFTTTESSIREFSDEDAKRSCAKYDLKYVRHPQNCVKFWICLKISENEFQAEPFWCGGRLHFDTARNICKSKERVQCG